MRGEGRLVLGRHGSLLVRTAIGTLVQGAPTGYQGEGSTERHVPVRFTLGPRGTAGIAARYDRTRRLVVDPAIGWATYLGGRGADSAHGIATDPAGNIYLAGTTGSADFPVKGSIEPFHTNPTGTGLIDVFVSKLNSAGTAIIFSTYLGGSSFDESYGLARDGTGICLAGDTGSRDFPLKNAFQPTYGGGGSDAFITRLAPAGDALIYSSYLGGSADDRFDGVADDGKGTCFAAGDSIPLSSGGGNSPVYPHLPSS